MEIKTDGKGQEYTDFSSVRITFISGEKRAEDKDWAGQDTIRISAYASGDSKTGGKIYKGPEIPINDVGEFTERLMAFVELLAQEGK